jgi:hypothetical protein
MEAKQNVAEQEKQKVTASETILKPRERDLKNKKNGVEN